MTCQNIIIIIIIITII